MSNQKETIATMMISQEGCRIMPKTDAGTRPADATDHTDQAQDERIIDVDWVGHTMEFELYVLRMRVEKLEMALCKAGLDWTLK